MMKKLKSTVVPKSCIQSFPPLFLVQSLAYPPSSQAKRSFLMRCPPRNRRARDEDEVPL